MTAWLFRIAVIASVVSGLAAAAHGEDLVMPYSCTVDANGVHVRPAQPQTYRILGHRDEQPFVDCTAQSACRTLMVHRFSLLCGENLVPWARIAAAATREAGVSLPPKLPGGYAPVSTMSGRFVLPPQSTARTAPAKVWRQALAPNSVIERRDDDDRVGAGGWETEVKADAVSPAPGGNAVRVAASIAAMLTLLMAASLVAAGRVRIPAFSFQGGMAQRFSAASRIVGRVSIALGQIRERAAQWQDWAEPGEPGLNTEILNAMSMLQARLLHVELKVAALEPSQLLRDVLTSEVSAIRARIADLEVSIGRAAAAKTSAIIRAMMRDLERINRIAESAARDASPEEERAQSDAMPQSEPEAYRLLGINPDAPPVVAKKLVDALRMSWHPDHARDEADRLHRERRMKQINAAWDIIKARHRAAA